MITLDIEIAIMKYVDIRANIVVPNVSWGMGLHECDILSLSKSGYATEYEIKVSKPDLIKDSEKQHGHVHNHIARLFFVVPESLKELALWDVIPPRAGLLIIRQFDNDHIVQKVRDCKRNKRAVKWNEDERYQLARLGAMRILSLKKKIVRANI